MTSIDERFFKSDSIAAKNPGWVPRRGARGFPEVTIKKKWTPKVGSGGDRPGWGDRPVYGGGALGGMENDPKGMWTSPRNAAREFITHGHPTINTTPMTPSMIMPVGTGEDEPTPKGRAVWQQQWGRQLTPNQFGSGLSTADAYAACGPAAAVAFARANGRNPSMAEAVQLARMVGWTPGAGMAGPASQVQLLKKMGVSSYLEAGLDQKKLIYDVQNGNPVTLSMPSHYFVASEYDSATQRFYVGASGTAVRGGEWMTLDDMRRADQRLGGSGNFNGVIYLDNPDVPTPSVSTIMDVEGTNPTQPNTGGPRDQAEAPRKAEGWGVKYPGSPGFSEGMQQQPAPAPAPSGPPQPTTRWNPGKDLEVAARWYGKQFNQPLTQAMDEIQRSDPETAAYRRSALGMVRAGELDWLEAGVEPAWAAPPPALGTTSYGETDNPDRLEPETRRREYGGA